MQKNQLKRFEFRLTRHIRDRKIAAWLVSLPNASERVKQVLAQHIEKEAESNG